MINEFLTKFVNDNNINWIMEIDYDGWHYPLLIPFFFILFIVITNFFTRNETKEDEYLIDGTTTSGGTTLGIIVTGLIIWASYKYIINPTSKEVISKFNNQFTKELVTLEKSKKVEDNIEFINFMIYLQKDELFKKLNIKYKTPKAYLINFFEKTDMYKNFNIEKYLKEKFIETKNFEFIKIGALELKDRFFIKVLYKKMCPNKKTKYKFFDTELSEYDKCNYKKILKEYKDTIMKLPMTIGFEINLAKNMKNCDGYNFLKEKAEYHPNNKKLEKAISDLNKKHKCENKKLEVDLEKEILKEIK